MKETKSMFNEMVLMNTRHVVNEGKEYFIDKEINMIIAYTLKKYDELNGVEIKEIDEYCSLADKLSNKQEIYNLVRFFVRTYKNKKNDEDLDDTNKVKLYRNSIEIAEKLCEDMTSSNKYNSAEALKDMHTERFENCRYKADIADEINRILALLKDIKANYILTLEDGYSFYPIITDFLVDTLSLEYGYEFNGTIVNCLKNDFNSLSMKKDILRFSNIIFFSQVEFTKKVQRKRVKLYILHEYARKFNCDVTLMRELHMELLYWDAKAHPRALKSEIFDIQKIKPRNFILTQCKFIGLVT